LLLPRLGTIDISAGLFNVFGRDVDLRFVGDRGGTPLGQGWAARLVRSDLADQIRDFGDLCGRRVAISYEGAAQHTVLGHSMERVGLGARDVDLMIVPISEVNAALANGAVDVTIGIEPFNTMLLGVRVPSGGSNEVSLSQADKLRPFFRPVPA
jgi:NitT/TauT family transport system substrate-binding protein